MAMWNKNKNLDDHARVNHRAIAEINQQIFEENKKLECYWMEIGKKYVAIHAENYETEFSDLMQEIAVSQRKLSNYTNQIKYLSGVVACSQCGHSAPRDSVYCNMCGSKLTAINYDNYTICSACGHLTEKTLRNCSHCKASISSVAAVQEKRCTNCGKVMSPDMRFCTACGTQLK